MSCEAGGLNSTTPFTVAAELGIPLVDGDMMGRAFPELQMCTPTLYRRDGDADGHRRREGQFRRHQHGQQPLDRNAGAHVDDRHGLLGDDRHLSHDRQAGQRDVRPQHDLPPRADRPDDSRGARAACRSGRGRPPGDGRLSHLARQGRRRRAAHADRLCARRGNHHRRRRVRQAARCASRSRTSSSSPDPTTRCWRPRPTSSPSSTTRRASRSRPKACATGSASPSLSMPCDPRWRSPEGLAVVGPGYFGYDVPYVPIEERSR